MQKATTFVLIGLAILASLAPIGQRALAAGAAADEAAPTCRKAEVNPVSGHVFCFDPIGAPVEAPPSAAAIPCKPNARTGEAWTYGPKCKS